MQLVFSVGRFLMCSMFCSVLWLPLTAAEHDAGLHPNVDLSTCNARKCRRLSRQGVQFVQSLAVLIWH